MVSIVSGASNSDREDIFIGEVVKSAQSGENVLVIVPDQFSFEYDKILYKALGARLFNSIKTSGFNRLAEQIRSQYGGSSGELAGDNARMILMFRAVRRFASEGNVRYYKKSLDKAVFLKDLIVLTEQLRQSGVGPDMLRLAAERLEGSVSLKLLDLAFIFRYYDEELERAGMKDTLSLMADAVRTAGENKYFSGMRVFVTAFNDFTYDEYRLLGHCIRDAKGLTVSLLLDDQAAAAYSSHPFAVTVKTMQKLKDIAAEHNYKPEHIKAVKSYFQSEDIAILSKRLFDYNRVGYKSRSRDVQLWAADDSYEEADFIAAEICRLVREEGLKYNDIVVATRDTGAFTHIIESSLERYGVPYYIDKRDSIDASAIVHYINAVFRTVLTRSFRTDNIMKLIKSPLFGLLNYEISDLEDYCITWGVDGDLWLSPFTAPAQSGARLERINEIREMIIAPLVSFKNASKDATAAEISRAFYTLLGEIKLSEQTYSLVKRASASDNETFSELSRGLKQLWSMSLSAVRSIYEMIGNDRISLRKYYELYSMLLSQMKVSNPPQKLDCVRVTDAGRSRIGGIKVLFAAELNDGIFPAQVKGSGLVTEHEKELLREKAEIFIEANDLTDLRKERLIAYSALSAPVSRLYMLYSRSDLLGKEKRASSLIREAKEILGINERNINTLPIDFFCTSFGTAYTKYIEHSREKTPELMSVRVSLEASPLYYGRIKNLDLYNRKQLYSLSPDRAKELFFGRGDAQVSPTKMETYYKCPFNFFVSYGLRLKKVSPRLMDGLNRGILAHAVLEKALSEGSGSPKEKLDRFLQMDSEKTGALIDSCFDEYYKESFGSGFAKSETFEYQFSQFKEHMLRVVTYVRQELAGGSFVPVLTELKIDPETTAGQLDLTLKDGRHIMLTGTIDRADICETDDGTKFLRIIDYKLRKNVKFDLAELYCGLELQMLVYLSMLLETDNEISSIGKIHQGGVLYLDIRGETPKMQEDCELSEEELLEAAFDSAVKSFSRKGCIIDLPAVRRCLDRDMETLGSLSVRSNMLWAMRIYAKNKVVEYGDRLLDGDIDARPIDGTCSVCDYRGICGRAFPDDPIVGNKELMKRELHRILEEESEKREETEGGEG